MTWIYLSPHLDDVAFSCGGLVWEQTQAGTPVEIWTICTGDPPDRTLSAFACELHTRWGGGSQAMARRRQEDIAACRQLFAAYRHLPYTDCIYRSHPQAATDLYPDREAIFGMLHPAESDLVTALAADLGSRLPPDAAVVCPLAIGGHVDHRLLRQAARRLPGRLWYYADFPYARQAADELTGLERDGWKRHIFIISPPAMDAWAAAIAAHASQVSSFWPDLTAMRNDLGAYSRLYGGIPLWQPPLAGL